MKPISRKLFSNAKNLSPLQNIVRAYTTHLYASSPREFSEPSPKTKEKALKIYSEFEKHTAFNHSFFGYLQEASVKGFTPKQFQIYRDNYFFRTSYTLMSALQHLNKAAENKDMITVCEVGKIIYDETGEGREDKVHLKLLEDSHNLHGKTVFGLNPLNITETENSPLLTDAVKMFRSTQEQLFSASYPIMTGCLFAHEGAADGMLEKFKKALFTPYSGYYTKEEFEDLLTYYTVHHDDSKEGGDIEKQHQEKANNTVARMLEANPDSEKEIFTGGMKFLHAQSSLWDSIMQEMEKAETQGKKILPKSGFLEAKQKPSSLVSVKSSHPVKPPSKEEITID